MKKVWVDVTDISVWSGHHTGTQRLVYQIAKRYLEQPSANFFVFNPGRGTFHRYDFTELVSRVEAALKKAEAEEEQLPQSTPRVRALAARVYHHSPQAVRRHLSKNRRRQIKKVLKKVRGLLKSQKNLIAVPKTPPIHFDSDDTVVITGKPWDYPTFLEVLQKEKLARRFKLVQVVYDLIPVFFPHLFGVPLFKPYTRYMFETTAISDGLLAISESTRKDILSFCKDMRIDSPPIKVIRLGEDFAEVTPKQPKFTVLEKGNFALCVGTLEVRKNHRLLYMTYKEASSRGIDMPKLVIVGGRGWYTDDIIYQFTHDPEMRDKVYLLSNINDHELEWLYQKCRLTVYPSIYEGWGLPIAESLARGKVCIASNTSSMTEISESLVEYFSPYDTTGCLELFIKYADRKLLKEKETAIKEKYQPTSWEDTFAQVQNFVSSLQ